MNVRLRKRESGDYRLFQKKYMEKHQTLCVTLSKENDKDIIEWLGKQENRSQAVREALREKIYFENRMNHVMEVRGK